MSSSANLLLSIVVAAIGVLTPLVTYVSWGTRITTLLEGTIKRVETLETAQKDDTKEQLLKNADQDASIRVIVSEISGMKASVTDMKGSVDKIADKVGAK